MPKSPLEQLTPQTPTQRAEAILGRVEEQYDRLSATIPSDSIDISPEVTIGYYLVCDPKIDKPSPPILIPEGDRHGLGRFSGKTVQLVVFARDLIGQCGLQVVINPVPVDTFLNRLKDNDFSIHQPEVTIEHGSSGPTIIGCSPELVLDTDNAVSDDEDVLTRLQQIINQVSEATLIRLPSSN